MCKTIISYCNTPQPDLFRRLSHHGLVESHRPVVTARICYVTAFLQQRRHGVNQQSPSPSTCTDTCCVAAQLCTLAVSVPGATSAVVHIPTSTLRGHKPLPPVTAAVRTYQ